MDRRNWYKILLIIFISTASFSQDEVRCLDPLFQEKIDSYLSYSVPFITVADAYHHKDKYIFLDAREKKEFEKSHIEGAQLIGYDDIDYSILDNTPKDTPIIIYCSIGYRSEKIGQQLIKKGFTNVFNLYGSIFEWVNQHHPVYDKNGLSNVIHTYNKKWSKWVTSDQIEKVW